MMNVKIGAAIPDGQGADASGFWLSRALHRRSVRHCEPKEGPSTLLVPDAASFQDRLARLPIMKCEAGEDVLTAGSTTGRLLVLRSGTVEVIKDGVQIAEVSAPG